MRATTPAYRARYIPGQDHYLATVGPRERADVVIDNRDPAVSRLRFRDGPDRARA